MGLNTALKWTEVLNLSCGLLQTLLCLGKTSPQVGLRSEHGGINSNLRMQISILNTAQSAQNRKVCCAQCEHSGKVSERVDVCVVLTFYICIIRNV